MNYLLSEEEYSSLTTKPDIVRKRFLKLVQELCTRICDNEEIEPPWPSYPAGQPWTCIYSAKCDDHYCDFCPVRDVCPCTDKQWSK